MWQRIQTLWWLVAAVAVALFASTDFLLYSVAGTTLPNLGQNSLGVEVLSSRDVLYQSYSVAVVAGISVALSLLSIFIYKMRPYQIRLSLLNTLLILGMLGVIAYTSYDFMEQSGAAFAGVTAWLSLPFVGIIAQLLALRGVLHDEMLVRMSNRIR